jgi:pimeloyl-ACP methyl ester carboxylesterase
VAVRRVERDQEAEVAESSDLWPAGADRESRAAVFVPGAVLPAALSYGPLLTAMDGEMRPVLKDLELYAGESPPEGYSVELEVEGVKRTADGEGLGAFHLVGYSAGGAVALAFAARYPERLLSLAVIEPARASQGDWSDDDRGLRAAIDKLPPAARVPLFLQWQMAPGVAPPQPAPGPPPEWMARRPAGLTAILRAFDDHEFHPERLRSFTRPAYIALGGLSNPLYSRIAGTLAAVLPDLRVELYEQRSHLDPPHRAEATRFAQALRDLWARAEALRHAA